MGDFHPLRYLSSWQETTSGGNPGHYKLGARFYNTNGVFTQPDALTGNLGDPRTMTSYNYAGGDPINQSDPGGYAFSVVGALKALDLSRSVYGVYRGYQTGGIEEAASRAGALLAGVAAGGVCVQAAVTAGAAATPAGGLLTGVGRYVGGSLVENGLNAFSGQLDRAFG